MKESPPEVQKAVSIASIQGVSFLQRLTIEVAGALKLDGVEKGLRLADQPHAFVSLDVIEDITSLGAFVQGIYHEVARGCLDASYGCMRSMSTMRAICLISCMMPRPSEKVSRPSGRGTGHSSSAPREYD